MLILTAGRLVCWIEMELQNRFQGHCVMEFGFFKVRIPVGWIFGSGNKVEIRTREGILLVKRFIAT